MKAYVTVTLKPGVLDPQGKAIANALGQLGFDDVGGVRQGRYFELDLNETDETRAHEAVSEHESVLKALRVRDGEAAEAAMRVHLEASHRARRRQLRSLPAVEGGTEG